MRLTVQIVAQLVQQTVDPDDLLIDAVLERPQMHMVLVDIGADSIKTGMLYDAAMAGCVADVIDSEAPGLPLVVDPVMLAQSGDALLDPLGALSGTMDAQERFGFLEEGFGFLEPFEARFLVEFFLAVV